MSLRQLRECSYGIYTPEQIERIIGAQREHNALATRIAYVAGLRGDELFNLLPASERPASDGVNWFPERFTGRDGVRYTVCSRHGLVREVLIPRDLAEQLEARRLPESVVKVCRQIVWKCHYNIGGGQGWEKSVISASRRTLGWSGGQSMMRNTYAHMRMRELQAAGMFYKHAYVVRSQEMGYLRPRDKEGYEGDQEQALDIAAFKKEIEQDMRKISRRTPYKTRQSRLDRYQEEIEYARYELGKTLVQIRKWLRKKHHVKVDVSTIARRLRKWKEQKKQEEAQ